MRVPGKQDPVRQQAFLKDDERLKARKGENDVTSPKLQYVMGSAYQRPFTLASFYSSPHKLVKTDNIVDLTKHRLDSFASNLIQLSLSLGQTFAFHQF